MDSSYLTLPRRDGVPSFPISLGYDPSAFPLSENIIHDVAYVVFGLCMYETIDCAKRLWNRRAKWRSGVYKAILFAIAQLVQGYWFSMLGYSSIPALAIDFFSGRVEVVVVIYGMGCVMLARWAFIYATGYIALAVFPANKIAKGAIFLSMLLALAGSIWYYIALAIFWGMKYENYLFFEKTNDIGALMSRIFLAIDYIPEVQLSAAFETLTIFAFMMITKLLFLWAIFNALEVPFKVAITTMAQTRSTRRIFNSWLLTVVDTICIFPFGGTDLSLAATLYSLGFQINTLAMLAFEGSSKIIEAHSIANRSSFVKKTDLQQNASASTNPGNAMGGRQVQPSLACRTL